MLDLDRKLNQIRVYITGVWHQKRYLLGVAAATCFLGWAGVATMPNQYETSTSVYADTNNILKPLLNGIAVQQDTNQEVKVTSRTLLSRDTLDQIAREADLHIAYPDPNAYESMLQALKEQIIINGSKSNVYSVSYRHPDPNMAFKVVDLTLKKFVDAAAGKTQQGSAAAVTFLEAQISEYEGKLRNSEQRLADFQRKHTLFFQKGKGYYSELAQFQQDHDNLTLEIKEKEAEIEGLKRRFLPSENADNADASTPIVSTPYDGRIASMQVELDNLRINYTEKHPRIIELKKQLGLLHERQSDAQKGILEQASQGALTSAREGESAVLQNFALTISGLSSERDVLVQRADALVSKIAKLEVQIDKFPSIEAEKRQLQREYNNDNEYYNDLLSRRDSAKITEDADQDTQDVKFQVLSPPRKATEPVGPPRIVFYTVVLFLGLALGTAAAFTASQVVSVVNSDVHLQQLIGRSEIIGRIQNADSNKSRREHRLKVTFFLGGMFILMAIFSALVGHDVVTGHSPLIWIK